MIYAFEDVNTGEEHELSFDSDHAPSIGDIVDVGGYRLRRIPSFSLDSAGIARKTHQYPYVSTALPKGMEGAEHTAKGKPIIRSQQHEREVMARHDMHKEL